MLVPSPHPVSISTNNGNEVDLEILLTSTNTSSRDVKPRSGIPYDAEATPLPDK